MKIVTVAQMVALERAADQQGVSTDVLMETAGLAVAEIIRETLGSVVGVPLLVLVGPGNNGGDGLVTARHLQRWGARVTAYLVARQRSPDPKLDLAIQGGVTIVRAQDDLHLAQLVRLLEGCRLVVDAVLGTGRARPLEGVIREVMLRLGKLRPSEAWSEPALASHPLLLALDLPTGLNADTGEVDPACPEMDITVALGFPKVGLVTFPGAERVGKLRVVDIGLPPTLAEAAGVKLELLTTPWVRNQLPPRPPDAHKGTFGHVLVVAGSRNYPGAAYLASQAAVRVGAGLVTLAAPQGIYPIVAAKLTEVIHLPLPEDWSGRIHPDAADVIRRNLSRYDCLLVGCGLGWSPGTMEFIERLLLTPPALDLPTVIDADGLNNLSNQPDWWRRLDAPAVLTPHPGEMSALTRQSVREVQQDRIATLRRWSGRWNLPVVLKGAHTLVGEPQGQVIVSPFANPGLASGGTGDVLTGIIAGLMAQGLSPYQAAACGVYLHGLTSEYVREELGEMGTIATDLVGRVPTAIKQLRQGAKHPGPPY